MKRAALLLSLTVVCLTAQYSPPPGVGSGSVPASQITGAPIPVVPGLKCDDTSDDTAALQAALNAGGVIFVPTGAACKVTSTLTVSQGNTQIIGFGSQEFVTANVPSTYLDYQGTGNALDVANQGFVMRDVGVKYPIASGGPVTQPSAPTLTATTGSLGAQTWYAEVTCLTVNGESAYSSEASIVLGSPGGIIVTAPTCTGGTTATGWNVYMAANSHNETKQNASALTLGVNYTQSVALTNNGYRGLIDTSASCAVHDSAAGQYHHVFLFTGAGDGDSHGLANGFCLSGSSTNIDFGSKVTGFNVGVLAATNVNNVSIEKNFFQANNYAIITGIGSNVRIVWNDFEANETGDIWSQSGAAFLFANNYFEQQLLASTVNFNVQLGNSASEVIAVGQAQVIQNVTADTNFIQCNGQAGQPPIVIQGVIGFTLTNTNLSNCGSQTNIVSNVYANAAAAITIRHNVSQNTLAGFISSTTGVTDYDFSTTAHTVGPYLIPSFSLTPLQGGVGLREAPMWLQFFGTGAQGTTNCSTTLTGEVWATNFTVAFGNTCTNASSTQPLIVRATGTCTIAGTLNARGADAGVSGSGDWGGSGAGGGGGAAGGNAGSNTQTQSVALLNGGTAGGSSGGTGGNGIQPGSIYQNIASSMPTGYPKGGSQGGTGGSGGGAGGKGGQVVVLACNTISFSGTISVAGAVGTASSGNNVGGGGGGGGGYVLLSALTYTANSGTIVTSGGTGGGCSSFTGCGPGGTGGAGWSNVITIQ